MTTAIVVGSGANGLAAAISLARNGIDVTVLESAETVGGGLRSSEEILPGLIHDHCAAFHPIAAGSRFLRGLGLERHGVRWAHAEIDCAHPLDGSRAGVLHRSVEQNPAGLDRDGDLWRTLFARTSRGFDSLGDDIMGPLLRIPSHPLRLARFGIPTTIPASLLARLFRTDEGRGLFGGIAAHTFRPLHRPLTSAIGIGIATAGHRYGWPVVVGGSGVLTTALVAILDGYGGKVETGVHVRSLADLPAADIVMLDLSPTAAAAVAGDRLGNGVRRGLERFRFGPGAFKVDFAVAGGVPWANPEVGRAGTVHLGGDFAEVAASERAIQRGVMPDRPFVLVGQQYVADPSRSAGDTHPLYAYAHVPAGYQGDATEAITAQIERFAPGFRERILGTAVRSATDMARDNPNFVGGDICTGAKDMRQLIFGPRTTLEPYRLGAPGLYLCSAATPPGPGAHGMCGANAAEVALRDLHSGRLTPGAPS
ncbi:MAG: NAD(P)/FAD-dependent oxidoreductase [Gordonia sp. (in: high G+C Gram-positive bacteria)]